VAKRGCRCQRTADGRVRDHLRERRAGVTALDAANGDVRWQTSVSDAATDSDADEPAVSPPTVAFESGVYVSADSGLSAIDCETGEIDWRCDSVTVTIGDPWEEQNEVDRTIEGGVAATDECVFVLAEAGTIVGLDPLTGEQGLTLDTYYYYLNDLVATDGRVRSNRVRGGRRLRFDDRRARGEMEERGIRRLAVRGETLVFVTGYELVAVDLESGDERWSVGKYSHSIGDPVIACNAVLVNFGLQGGKIRKLARRASDLDDGSEQVFSRTESAFVGGVCGRRSNDLHRRRRADHDSRKRERTRRGRRGSGGRHGRRRTR